jgi:hypothetical protein
MMAQVQDRHVAFRQRAEASTDDGKIENSLLRKEEKPATKS